MQSIIQSDPELALLIGGLIIGFAFGFVVQRTNFCAMGALSDMVAFGDTRRFRAWMLSASVAILGAQALHTFAIVDLNQSRYLAMNLNWLGQMFGGFIFGIGMVLAGGCASRNLVRAGGGDLRALLLLLVVAMFAFATISGAFGNLRVSLAEATHLDLKALGLPTPHLGDAIATISGTSIEVTRTVVTSVAGLALLVFIFTSQTFRTSWRHIVSGLGIGLAVVAAWALTSLAHDVFADRPTAVESLSYVAPMGAAVDWFERATALGLPSFGAATVFGTLAGGFVGATVGGTFCWQTFSDVDDTLRHLAGGALMGVGGVLALGCTIGQGVSGLSTLALGSLLSVAAIIAGGITMLRVLMR